MSGTNFTYLYARTVEVETCCTVILLNLLNSLNMLKCDMGHC